MKIRMHRTSLVLIGLLLSIASHAFPAVADLAVFRDTALPTNWMPGPVADALTSYLTGKGYARLDTPGLVAFLQKHISDHAASAVVMANDVLPYAILNPINDQPNPDNPVRQYLDAGGKMIFLGDWPAYGEVRPDGSRISFAGPGAAIVFGFSPADFFASAVLSAPVVFDSQAAAWGLTRPWISDRGADPGQVDFVLGHPTGNPSAAMPWVKQFTHRPGSGMLYLYDSPDAIQAMTADDFAQVQRVAEYFPSGASPLSTEIAGVLEDFNGNLVPNAGVHLSGGPGNIRRSIVTDANGAFAFFVDPGTYTLDAGVVAADNLGAISTSVAQGRTANVTLTLGQALDLSTAGGQSWQLQVPAMNAGEDPNQVALDPSSAFIAYKAPGDWTLDILKPPASNNIYAWYRTAVNVPAAMVGKDLVLKNFNMDDIDWTYWNGQFIGSTYQWNQQRAYVIPGSLVKATNSLVMLNYNYGGGAGMDLYAPLLSVVRQGAAVKGRITDQSGSPIYGIYVTAVSQGAGAFGAQIGSGYTDPFGNYLIGGLGAGSYVVKIGNAPAGSIVPSPSSAATALSAGQILTYNSSIFLPVPIAHMSPRAPDLPAGHGWRFLGQTEVNDGPDKDADRALIENNTGAFAAVNYADIGKDSIVTKSTWISDWPFVPGDAGPDGRAGKPGGIPDNTDWVSRIHFTLSGTMDQGDRYEITGFNIDDRLFAAYLNGVYLKGIRYDSSINQSLFAPAYAVRHGGRDNVLTLIGQETGAAAGFTQDFGGPNLVAIAPLPPGQPEPLVNGDFATGDLTGWTADSIDGGWAVVVPQGGVFSGIPGSNEIPFPDGPGGHAANVRSSAAAPLDSTGILTSDPFVPRSGSLAFTTLSESAMVAPTVLILTPTADPINPAMSDILLQANVVHDAPGTGATASFQYQSLDISAEFDAKKPIRVQFRQHTTSAGAGYFTLITDVDDTGPRLGDLSGDGKMDAADLSRAIGIFIGTIAPTDRDLEAGDVRPKPGTGGRPYGDGRIGADDLNWLFRYFLHLETAP